MNDESEVVAKYTVDSTTPVSFAIIQGIASVKNVEMEKLNFVLYDYVDPDALDSLIKQENSSDKLDIKFPIEDHRIEVSGDGTIRIIELS